MLLLVEIIHFISLWMNYDITITVPACIRSQHSRRANPFSLNSIALMIETITPTFFFQVRWPHCACATLEAVSGEVIRWLFQVVPGQVSEETCIWQSLIRDRRASRTPPSFTFEKQSPMQSTGMMQARLLCMLTIAIMVMYLVRMKSSAGYKSSVQLS